MTQGLTLLAEHQQGVVPKIVAKLRTGGQTFHITRNIARPTAAQFAQMQACFEKLRARNGGGAGTSPGGGFGGGGGLGGGRPDRGAFAKCLPASLRRLRTQFTTPRQTLQQVLDPPQTNITTSAYTIGGVDQTHPTMGVVTSAGREGPLPRAGRRQGGARLDRVRGEALAEARLEARPERHDVHLPLRRLQTLAHETGRANVVLVRARSSKDMGAVKQAIETRFPNAQVASSKDVADTISGSLVDASNLSHDLGLALSIVAAAAAFLVAALLSFSSVGKRVRELGTLKALGWTQRMVVRQVAGESVSQGVLGGVVGIAVGSRRDRVRACPARRPDRGDGRRPSRRAHAPRRRSQAGRVTAPLYRLRAVSKLFQRGSAVIRALDGIDLEVEAGEFVAFEGPSGSGKTTLLQLLGALDRPSSGEVLFEGRDLAELPDRELAALRLRSFGFVFQQFNLIPTLTAVENVEAKLAPVGGDRNRALRLLDEVGLAERAEHLPAHMSGGERQRVAIARALSVEPRVVLAEEPTGNLDSQTGGEIVDLLASLAAEHGSTVIVATHDASLAARAPRRPAVRDGRLLGLSAAL